MEFADYSIQQFLRNKLEIKTGIMPSMLQSYLFLYIKKIIKFEPIGSVVNQLYAETINPNVFFVVKAVAIWIYISINKRLHLAINGLFITFATCESQVTLELMR